jgi:iron complex outermembrane receptor protein
MIRAGLLCSTILAGVSIAAAANAGEAIQEEQEGVTTVDTLIITGTRLVLPDFTSSSPTMSADQEQLERSGDTTLVEFLLDTPALIASIDDVQASDSSTPFLAGLNLLDLRNLGAERTLVLVNGRRHVGSLPGTTAVDVGSIPFDLVERVDVVTGGQSAVYGADAVSGVVNFILKDDYDGATAHVQYGESDAGGGATTQASLVMGRNFLDGLANITGAIEYYDRGDVKFEDREYTRRGLRQTLADNPDELFGDDPDVPDLILSNNLRYIDTSTAGSVFTTWTGFDFVEPDFLGNGDPFIPGVYTGGFIAIGGSGTLLDEFNDDLIPGVERVSANLIGHIDVTPRIRLFAEAKYSTSEADFEEQPPYDFALIVPLDNPFIPAVIYDDAVNNPDSLALDFGFFFDSPAPEGAIAVARDHVDGGRETWTNTNEVQRFVVGANGLLTDALEYEVSYVYGRADQEVSGVNRINERFYAGADAIDDGTGNIVCRTDLFPDLVPTGDIFSDYDPSAFGQTFTPGPNSGCVPFSIFGENQISQEARDWFNTPVTDRARIEQQVLTAFVRGDTANFYEFQYGGPISYVFGAEYRDERSQFNPDPLGELSADLGFSVTNGGAGTVTEGDFNVKELFTEVNLPFVVDQPYGREVAATLAYRFSDYSTAGETHTWNAGARWAFNDTLMIRGSIAKAVRAPNVNNLFRGLDQTFAQTSDPCSLENVDTGEVTTLRITNCQMDFAPYGYTIGNGTANPWINNTSDSTPGFLAGNPLLEPEKAYTKTLGFVYTPSYVEGLSLAVDYYNIDIDGAITSYTANAIISNCYDLPRPNPFCDLIERYPIGHPREGQISNFLQVPGNIATFQTRGTDFSIAYSLDPFRFGAMRDYGVFDFRMTGTFLDKLRSQPTEDAPVTLDDGDIYAPTFQASFDATWTRGPWQVNYGLSYFNETRRVSRVTRVVQPDYVEPQHFDYSAREEHDIRVAYTYDDRYEFYGGVNNITDQEPEFQDYWWPVSPLGRYFYAGVRAEF